jgi:hypothetical protein
MIGAYKKFDAALFDNNDPKSREVVKSYLASNGIPVNDNPDKYGVDLISSDGKIKVEVERRLVWKSVEFPFNEINIPERKAKFFKDQSVAYVIVSVDYTRIGMIQGKTLTDFIKTDNLKENPNLYTSRGEMFFKVPKSAFKWITL